MRTSNPAFSNKNAFGVSDWSELGGNAPVATGTDASSKKMTIQGTVNASFILITATIAAAMASWYLIQNSIASVWVLGLGGLVVGLICAAIIYFSPKLAMFLAWPYAIAEGALLGAISLLAEERLAAKIGAAAASGLVFQAVILTFGIFISLLLAYKFRLVRVGGKLKTGIIIATAGVGILYLASFLMSMLGFGSIGLIHSSGPWGIGFSVVVVILASLNLLLDFQFIEDAAEQGAPKHMEWYGAFALLTTLIWLYIEVLRLLAKIAGRKE
jgi:uncharacterized YccA/Bax inhibitor family protein